jgi:ribosomal protein S2
MKLKKIVKHKNKLLKLGILKTKILNKYQYLNGVKIEDIENRLKKILHIIYKYNISKKRILFVGLPLNTLKLKKITKKNNHVFLPSKTWIRGIIYNRETCLKHLSKNKKRQTNKISKIILQLKKTIDLIIIFDETSNIDVINEGYLARVPIISLGNNLDIRFEKPSYKVPGNFKFIDKKFISLNKTRNYFLNSLLIAILGRNYKNN